MENKKSAKQVRQIARGLPRSMWTRSRDYTPVLGSYDKKRRVYTYKVGGHNVMIKIVKGPAQLTKSSDIKVSCSCPFWVWQGPEYHAKREKYLFGTPRGTAAKPEERDPKGKHRVCKHVLSVLKTLK